ncbi:MAG: hypothetical protein AB1634_19000 [Thermodesulfobacteriota bacterium]
MMLPAEQSSGSREAILAGLVEIVQGLTADWDMLAGAIGPETRLGVDLGFASMDFVRLVMAIDQRFGTSNLPYESLLLAGDRDPEEIRLVDLADFLARHLPAGR